MENQKNIAYPLFLIEDKAQRYAIYNIIYSKDDFVVFSRVPPKGEYKMGIAFDSAGYVYSYAGSSGMPRFAPTPKLILEILILPSVVFKLMAKFIYYGPTLQSREKLSTDQFRELLIEKLSRYEKGKDRVQLVSLLDKAIDYKAMIDAVDFYRKFGGNRDEDGHEIK